MGYDINSLNQFAADNTWIVIWPEIILAVTALGLLVLEILLPKVKDKVIPFTAQAVQILVFAGIVISLSWKGMEAGNKTAFSGLITLSSIGNLYRLFFILCSILVCHMATGFLHKQNLAKVEFYTLILIATAGLMLLVQSTHFIMFFVSLETVTICFYVLISYLRKSSHSLEAGLKYLIMGSLSSALLVFGIVLLYGGGGMSGILGPTVVDPLSFSELAVVIVNNPENLFLMTGAFLVLAGICFKIGAFPFQIWIPDVYQGAPTPITALLAVASKAGGFFVLLNLVKPGGPFNGLNEFLVPLLTVIAVLTILFGNLSGLTQKNLKRLMGASGIAHAGYLLVGVIAAFQMNWAANVILFYLFTYLLASFAVFQVMNLVSGQKDSQQRMIDYEELARERPFLAVVLVIGLGSLAGVPPLAGFMGKLLLFILAYKAGFLGLLIISFPAPSVSRLSVLVRIPFIPSLRPAPAPIYGGYFFRSKHVPYHT